MAQFIIQEECRCIISNYITANNKKEALEKLYSWEVDSTELESVLDTIEVYDKEIHKVGK